MYHVQLHPDLNVKNSSTDYRCKIFFHNETIITDLTYFSFNNSLFAM